MQRSLAVIAIRHEILLKGARIMCLANLNTALEPISIYLRLPVSNSIAKTKSRLTIPTFFSLFLPQGVNLSAISQVEFMTTVTFFFFHARNKQQVVWEFFY